VSRLFSWLLPRARLLFLLSAHCCAEGRTDEDVGPRLCLILCIQHDLQHHAEGQHGGCGKRDSLLASVSLLLCPSLSQRGLLQANQPRPSLFHKGRTDCAQRQAAKRTAEKEPDSSSTAERKARGGLRTNERSPACAYSAASQLISLSSPVAMASKGGAGSASAAASAQPVQQQTPDERLYKYDEAAVAAMRKERPWEAKSVQARPPFPSPFACLLAASCQRSRADR
jgi:hypothetical protein